MMRQKIWRSDAPFARWLANENGQLAPARNTNVGNMRSMMCKPAHSTCCICAAIAAPKSLLSAAPVAIRNLSMPIIHIMSNPRRASIDRIRFFSSILFPLPWPTVYHNITKKQIRKFKNVTQWERLKG